MRYSYALKKFPKDSYASEVKAFRELHYNLLLSLCRCKRKLGVSNPFYSGVDKKTKTPTHLHCTSVSMKIELALTSEGLQVFKTGLVSAFDLSLHILSKSL